MTVLKTLLLLVSLLAFYAADATSIGTIQGAGAAAVPGTYTIEAVVTAVYPDLNPGGYYVQDEAATADGDPVTSDALFVVQAQATVHVGDRLRLTGLVREHEPAPSYGQAVLLEPEVTVLATAQPLPAFTLLDNATFSADQLERYEGMRVQFSGPLTVTDIYSLRQRGELTLCPTGIAYQPTQFIDPNDDPATGTRSTGAGNLAALRAYQAATESRSILLDDGRAAVGLARSPYFDLHTGTVRVGSTLSDLRAILGYGFKRWRLQPLPGPDAPVIRTVRPLTPPAFGPHDVKIASFNVLNYFNGDGQGGGFPTARGAKTPNDLRRQRIKLLLALRQMNADVVALSELENDGNGPTSALQDLVDGLNVVMGTGTYAFVDDGGATRQPNNTDVIRCALLYKPQAVRPLGPARVAMVPGVFERPPLAQVFVSRRRTRPDTLAVVVNHFKSKGSGSGVDADQHDGQGGSNDRRRGQARALVEFINKTVIPAGATRVVSVGDYNANYEEDPIDILRAAGLVAATPPISASYVYKGLTGSLDHAVVTRSLLGFIDVQKWHINSAEPHFLEYDIAGAATDTLSPFRSSDHDPVLIAVNFRGMSSLAGTSRLLDYSRPTAGVRRFTLRSVPASAGLLTLEFSLPQGPRLLLLHGPIDLLQAQLSTYTAHLAPGIYLLKLRGRNFRQTQRVMKR